MQGAEGVGKAAFQQPGHFRSLLVGEAGVHAVGLGIFQIHLLMGHVQVAAVHHGLFPVQLQKIRPQIVLPLHPVGEPLQPVLTVGGIAAHQIEVRVLRRDDPALVAVDILSEAVGDGQGLLLGQHRRAGVAFFIGGVKVAVIALQIEHRLLRLELGLLQAEDVRVLVFHIFQKALGQARPQAIDVPAYQLHRGFLLFSAGFFDIIPCFRGKSNKAVDRPGGMG